MTTARDISQDILNDPSTNDANVENTKPELSVLPGTLLKEHREQLGLSQRSIADRLRLRLSIITSLEENDFNDNQGSTFTRGYLRSYAKAVNADEKIVLLAYEECVKRDPDEHNMQSFSRQTKRKKHDKHIMTITWVILAVIVGISSLWWWQNSKLDSITPTIDAPSVTVVDEQSKTVDEVEPFTSLEEALSLQEGALTQSATEAVDTQSLETENTSAAPPMEPVAKPLAHDPNLDNVLVLTFDADCWIQITDATGKILATGIKKAGVRLEVRGDKPLQVVLGAPEGVSVTLAGEPVDLSEYTSGKVARFTLS